jgi:hypothetical protein
MVADPTKDVIYVDVDDEITSLIDKVTESEHKIVALVLPKRSSVLQSIVNMKLLKRSADDASKNVVLITSEPSLLPLAGAVGLYVAKTAQSKPEIPTGPRRFKSDDSETVDESELGDDEDTAAGAAAAGAEAAETDSDESIELDNEPKAAPVKTKESKKAKKGTNRKLKVPNFNRFRAVMGLAILAVILLIGFGVYAFTALPRATVAISTDSETLNKTLDVTFDATADAVDTENLVVPSVVERVDRTSSKTVEATGERNDGKRAKGDIELKLCATNPGDVQNVPAGTGVSSNGKNYITQEEATFQFNFTGCSGGGFEYKTNKVDIEAAEGGSSYNVEDGDFTVNGSTATGEGDADGGTDDIVRIVSQEDIDSLKNSLEKKKETTAEDELKKRLEDRDLFVIEESFNASASTITTDAKAGDEAEEVTASRKATFSMLGVAKEDLDALITAVMEQDIDKSRQEIIKTGADEAIFKLQNQKENSAEALMSMDVTSVAGPKLDEENLKQAIAGMKAAEAEALIGDYPGVTGVEVTYGPFWVSAIPKNPTKIIIVYDNSNEQ